LLLLVLVVVLVLVVLVAEFPGPLMVPLPPLLFGGVSLPSLPFPPVDEEEEEEEEEEESPPPPSAASRIDSMIARLKEAISE
jgi:hypothetical protein